MREQFVTREIASALKEIEFDENCLAGYENYLDSYLLHITVGKHTSVTKIPFYKKTSASNAHVLKAPLWQQVIDWFISEHDMFLNIFKWEVKYYLSDELQPPKYLFDLDKYSDYTGDYIYQSITDELKYNSYKEAREQAILKAIEIIKEKKYESTIS